VLRDRLSGVKLMEAEVVIIHAICPRVDARLEHETAHFECDCNVVLGSGGSKAGTSVRGVLR
jgi:hypothetical protein